MKNADDDAAAGYGPETELALSNFAISGTVFPLSVIHAMVRIKGAAIEVHGRRDPEQFPRRLVEAVTTACDEVLAGTHDVLFPIDVFQTGSGTSSHMNINEVLASIASAHAEGLTVDAHDHVNAAQSSNDVVPSAVRMVAAALTVDLVAALGLLERELGLKEQQLKHVVKAGRTHMRDATPVTLGQEFGGYRQQVHDAAQRLEDTVEAVSRLPLGGTAVGNGLNAPVGFAADVISLLANSTELPLTETPDHFAAQGAHDDLLDLSARVRGAAIAVQKIANDLRLLSSGPRTGLGEIELAPLQPGSSIMPGKTNPVVVEVVNQVVARIIGNDAGIAFAGTQGVLELNTYVPVIAHDLLESLSLLRRAVVFLAERAVVSLMPDVERCRAYAEQSPAIATALSPIFGYDGAGQIIADSSRLGRTIVEVARERAVAHGIAPEEIDSALDLLHMALGSVRTGHPDLPGEDPYVPSEIVEPDDSGMIGPSNP